ncbi:MAG: hypothetical protein ACP5NE_02160 [Candidatus Micrarchaeia archaeon]
MQYLKAQFWSFDLIFSIIIFSVALTILTFTWFGVNSQLSLAYGNGATLMQLQASTFAQTLMSPGAPSDWAGLVNTTNPSTWGPVSIGLASRPGSTTLSLQKIYAFMSMANANYQATKPYLGIAYEYYVVIKGPAFNITIGSSPSQGKALTTYVVKKSVVVDGSPAVMDVIVWTNKPLAVV